MTKPLLTIRNMTKKYGSVTAINNISVDFYAGEFIVVIDPSGAGKSTFIRCINQLVPISSGGIQFDGVPLHALSTRALRKQRAKIGMIFQHYNLVGRTNVIKNVLHGRLAETPLYKSMFGLYSDEDKQEAVELLTKVGLMLTQSINAYNYAQTTTIVLVICVLLISIEIFITKFKQTIKHGKQA